MSLQLNRKNRKKRQVSESVLPRKKTPCFIFKIVISTIDVSRLFLLGIYQRVLMFKTCFEALCTAVFCYRSWGLTDALILLGAVPTVAAGSELHHELPTHMACPHIN